MKNAGWEAHNVGCDCPCDGRVAPRLPWVPILLPVCGSPPEVNVATLLNSNDPHRMLSEANRYYWTHNFPAASPLYEQAEKLFEQSHDERNALYAKVGLVRSQFQMPFGEMSDYLAAQLKTPLVQNDPALRLFCLGIKGDADLEVKAGPARQDWEQAKNLAEQLGDKQWANRASGELGLVNFLEGNYHQASYLVGHTLLTAIRDGDVGTQVRYLEIIGNGLNGLNRPSEGMVFSIGRLPLPTAIKMSALHSWLSKAKRKHCFC